MDLFIADFAHRGFLDGFKSSHIAVYFLYIAVFLTSSIQKLKGLGLGCHIFLKKWDLKFIMFSVIQHQSSFEAMRLGLCAYLTFLMSILMYICN